MAKTVEITNSEELDVLRRYAAGEDLKTISKALGFPVRDGAPDEVVVGIVSSLAGFRRERAVELVRRAEQKMAQRAAAPQVDVPVTPRVTATMPPGPPMGAEVVLARAERAGGRYAAKAGKVRALVAALEAELAEAERVIAQERRVQELKAELDRENAKLRELRSGKPVAAKPAPALAAARPTPREVRAWAAANGVECGPLARIPASVMEKYFAAHPEVPRG